MKIPRVSPTIFLPPYLVLLLFWYWYDLSCIGCDFLGSWPRLRQSLSPKGKPQKDHPRKIPFPKLQKIEGFDKWGGQNEGSQKGNLQNRGSIRLWISDPQPRFTLLNINWVKWGGWGEIGPWGAYKICIFFFYFRKIVMTWFSVKIDPLKH